LVTAEAVCNHVTTDLVPLLASSRSLTADVTAVATVPCADHPLASANVA